MLINFLAYFFCKHSTAVYIFLLSGHFYLGLPAILIHQACYGFWDNCPPTMYERAGVFTELLNFIPRRFGQKQVSLQTSSYKRTLEFGCRNNTQEENTVMSECNVEKYVPVF